MMKTKLIAAALVVSVVLMVVPQTVAQNKRIGTAAATELLIPTGARDFAMGGSTISNSTGLESIYWNPAGLGRLRSSTEAMFSSLTWIGDVDVAFGAVGSQFGDFGTVAFSVKSVGFGDIALTTDDDPEGRSGRIFSPTYVTIGLSYGRALTDAISVGGSLKLVSEQIDRVNSSGFALDFGVQYSGLAGINGLQIGVAVKNIGPQMQFEGSGLLRDASSSEGRRPEQKYSTIAAAFELPSTVEIGLSYMSSIRENINYTVGGSFANNNLYVDEFRIGGELSYGLQSLTLFGRVGTNFVPQAKLLGADSDKSEDENIFGPSFGLGVRYATSGIDVTVDFAYRTVQFFDGNSVIAVKFGF